MATLPKIGPWGPRVPAAGGSVPAAGGQVAKPITGGGQKLVINKLDNIRSILGQIKLDTGVIAKALAKPTSGQTARGGLKPRISKPRAGKKKMDLTKSLTNAIKKSFGKIFDWSKWFALLGLGLLFKNQIIEFIIGAFEPLIGWVSDWWKLKVLPALKGLDKALNPFGDKGLFSSVIKVVSDWSTDIGKKFDKWGDEFNAWTEDWFGFSPKNMILGSPVMKTMSDPGGEWQEPETKEDGSIRRVGGLMGEGGPLDAFTGYFAGIGRAFKTLSETMGISEDGKFTIGAKAVGIGLLAFLFTVAGPIALAVSVLSGIASLGIGTAKIAWKLVRAGFLAIAGMSGLRAAAAAPGGTVPPVVPSVPGTTKDGFKPGSQRMIGTGTNKQRIIKGATNWHVYDKTAEKGLGRQVTRGMLNPSLNAAGRGGTKLATTAAVTGASRSASIIATMARGGISFMGGLLTNPIVIAAAAIGAVGWIAYQHVKKKDKQAEAQGQTSADKIRAAIAAGTATPVQEATYEAAGMNEADKKMAVLKKRKEALTNQAAIEYQKATKGPTGDFKRESIANSLKKQHAEIDAQIKELNSEVNQKIGYGIDMHNTEVLKQIVQTIFMGGNKIIGRPSINPLTIETVMGQKYERADFMRSFRGMQDWAVDPANSGKKITMSLLKSFGVIPSSEYEKMQHRHSQLNQQTQKYQYKPGGSPEALQKDLALQDGIEKYAREAPRSTVPASTTRIKKEVAAIVAKPKAAEPSSPSTAPKIEKLLSANQPKPLEKAVKKEDIPDPRLNPKVTAQDRKDAQASMYITSSDVAGERVRNAKLEIKMAKQRNADIDAGKTSKQRRAAAAANKTAAVTPGAMDELDAIAPKAAATASKSPGRQMAGLGTITALHGPQDADTASPPVKKLVAKKRPQVPGSRFYRDTKIPKRKLGRLNARDKNYELLGQIYRLGKPLTDPSNLDAALEMLKKGGRKKTNFLESRIRIQGKKDTQFNEDYDVEFDAESIGDRGQVVAGKNRGSKRWWKTIQSQQNLTKRRAALLEKDPDARKLVPRSQTGSIAGRAAAETATLNRSAINAQTLSQSPGTPPVVVAGGGGNGNSGSNIPSTPLVFQTPPGSDYRSSKDRN